MCACGVCVCWLGRCTIVSDCVCECVCVCVCVCVCERDREREITLWLICWRKGVFDSGGRGKGLVVGLAQGPCAFFERNRLQKSLPACDLTNTREALRPESRPDFG